MAPAPAAPVAPAAPPAPAAPSAAVVAALTEQAQLVQALAKELQETKDSLAREQAHVRTVKAYYQTTEPSAPAKNATAAAAPAHVQPQSASSTNPFALPLFAPPSSSDSNGASTAPASAAAGMADTLRAEVAHLRKQNELLQVQNEAAQEIMRIRDRQAAEHRAALPQLQRGSVAVEPDLSLLWRDKVFALLVQNKSLLLSHAGDIRGYKQQLLSQSQTARQLEQQVQLLSQSNASLQTQLQLSHNDSAHRQRAQEQAHLMQTQAQASAQRTRRDVANIRHLLAVFQEQTGRMEEQSRTLLDAKLHAFNRRLGFAQQRVEVVRAIKLARRGGASAAGAGAGGGAGTDAPPRSGPIPLIPLPESKEADEAVEGGDPASQHLRKEIDRLQKE